MPARLVVLSLFSALFLFACGGGVKSARIRSGSMPPGGSFSGVWFSPQYGEMHMVQNGATAIGRYEKEERRGRIQGSVEGDVMRFEWSERREIIVGHPMETKGHGYFRIVRDEAEDTWKLVGEWGTDLSETGGGPWNAVKSKTLHPDVSGHDHDGSGGAKEPASDSAAAGSESSGGDDANEP